MICAIGIASKVNVTPQGVHLLISKLHSILANLLAFNPLLPIEHKSARIDQNFDSKIKRDYHKISYERRDYESVDEKSLSKTVSKNYEKENSGTKGLIT